MKPEYNPINQLVYSLIFIGLGCLLVYYWQRKDAKYRMNKLDEKYPKVK